MRDALSVKCPYCAAKPGYACTSAYDYRVVRTHAARARAAEREERGEEKGEDHGE